MTVQAFVILISLFLCFKTNAFSVASCEKQDSEYITAKHSSGELIQANETLTHFPRGSLNQNEICKVSNELMMDGLAFTLYKPETQKERYIAVYNGLDGSYKLYGPFKE